ncbi:MAG: type IX secretion system membrane protein PorP/SprF [Saprospiraceae bacterium]
MKLNTAINRIGVSSACHRMREMGIAMFCLTFFLFFSENIAHAQQEPQFTKYMFNTLAYNPGYAGSRGYMSIVALHRDQWLGWGNGAENDGRPVTRPFPFIRPSTKRSGWASIW